METATVTARAAATSGTPLLTAHAGPAPAEGTAWARVRGRTTSSACEWTREPGADLCVNVCGFDAKGRGSAVY